ncbi:MAG: RagB/SusD family nutrient uptake outer membrane protein [Prolixibacteraceae bacterium]
MKQNIKRYIGIIGTGVLLFAGCDDFLDRSPLDKVTPEAYFSSESDLAAYSIKQYEDDGNSIFTVLNASYGLGTFKFDDATDNQANVEGNTRWVPGEWKVETSGGDWDFNKIRRCNYFFEQVLPRYESGAIQGNDANIRHYIGEMYLLRAYIYFTKLTALGDFPIITGTLSDDKATLIEASKRRPRNEVARFILEDCDRASGYLLETPPNGKNRLSRDAAYLIKSRAALFEGTWLKYHKGTAQVPGGPGWPGASMDYLKGFTIDIDKEISYFLDAAKKAAEPLAEKMAGALTPNSGIRLAMKPDGTIRNQYYMMFASQNMEKFNEIIFWRAFSSTEYAGNVQMELQRNGGGSGYTKGFAESFLMKNGLPVYATGSGYKGDETLADVFAGRDDRFTLFTKYPGDTLCYYSDGKIGLAPYPQILNSTETRSSTGYTVKKGMSYDGSLGVSHHVGNIGAIVFRGAEALLNYIEADYELNHSLDSKSDRYWKALRVRAGVNPDYNKTIQATLVSKEAEGDFGAYSHGQLIDATLYNIRRERRCEFIAEAMRWNDLIRWRALDQIATKPYIIEGFKLWGPMQNWYKDENGSKLVVDPVKGNVSPKEKSLYLRPYQIVTLNNSYYNGYKWNAAHYLKPIAMKNFIQTSTSASNIENSIIYQNPGWSKVAGEDIVN